MALIDRIFGSKKSLSDLSHIELRKEEILLSKQRDRLFKKVEDIAAAKQKIFQQGAQQKSPELRKSLAQDFEIRTQEQLMVARELNLRAKELMTVSRLRMIRENQSKTSMFGRLNVTDKDVAKISGWINDDGISQEMYLDRLNTILSLGEESDREALERAGLSSAGQELMDIWDRLDKGAVKETEAFEEADKVVRQKQAQKEL